MNKRAGRQKDAPPSHHSDEVFTSPAIAPPPMLTRRERRRQRRWRLSALPLLVALAITAGTALLLYPAAAAWFTAVEQSQEIDKLTRGINDLGAETLRERLAAAREYNQGLSGGGAAIAANERLPLANEPPSDVEREYLSILRGDSEGLMARIRIPSIKVDLPIYHGTSDAVLEHGIGHLEGTALPVGGLSTHSVVTGHRGLATSELFTNLNKIVVNDTFTVEVFGEVLTYRVTETIVVAPEDTESLFIQPGKDLMTLVTCTPLGINSHRILVTGERIIPTPLSDIDASGETPDVPGFPWWMFIAGGVILGAGTYVWVSGRPREVRTGQARGR